MFIEEFIFPVEDIVYLPVEGFIMLAEGRASFSCPGIVLG